MEAIVSGLVLPEALRFIDGFLYFSDAAAGGVYRWCRAGVETVVPKRRGVGGLAPHSKGGIVITGRNLIHVGPEGTRTLFAADGARGLNDLTTDAAGRVYVGTLRMDWARPAEGSHGEVWRVDGEGSAVPLLEPVGYPNGTAFSPDGERIYVADFVGACVHVAALKNGSVVARSVLARLDSGNADGLAVDEEGCVWVATGSGGAFHRYSPDGHLLDRLETPAPFAVTLCFGGGDDRDLYLATAGNGPGPSGSIFKLRSSVAGVPLNPATV
jgi:sugar lactone lactonase YvrE